MIVGDARDVTEAVLYLRDGIGMVEVARTVRAVRDHLDVDPDTVAIGQRVQMTFRRLYTTDGVHDYFWKARPARANTGSTESSEEA